MITFVPIPVCVHLHQSEGSVTFQGMRYSRDEREDRRWGEGGRRERLID